MRATYVEAQRTPFTPAELAQAYEFELGGDGKVRPEYIAVLMAHCALECGRDVKKGLVGPACWNFNLGNVKAGETWPYFYTCITLNEYLVRGGVRKLIWFAPEGELTSKGGKLVYPKRTVPEGDPQTRMRALENLAQGVRAKASFLSQARFMKAVAKAQVGDAIGYTYAIHEQKYFTADVSPYARGMASLYQTYLPIAKKITDTPLVLKPEYESQIDQLIAAHATAPSMLSDLTDPEHVARVQFDLRQTIDWAGMRTTDGSE